jgi:hypothetical protein
MIRASRSILPLTKRSGESLTLSVCGLSAACRFNSLTIASFSFSSRADGISISVSMSLPRPNPFCVPSQSIARKAIPNATEKHRPGVTQSPMRIAGPIARSGTFLLIPSLERYLTEDFNGKSSMEAARLADRQEGSTESKPLVQTPVTAALVDDGREQAETAGKRQHADRRNERQASTTGRGYPQQGSARRDISPANKSIAL